MRIVTPVVILVLSLLGSARVMAATYYVDRFHPQSSNGNPGSEELPWRTIQHAAGSVVAGDVVLIKKGIYSEQVVISVNGSEDAWITFSAKTGHDVVIDGSGVTLSAYEGLVEVNSSSHIRVEGLRVQHAGPNGTNTGISVSGSSNVVIDGNRTEDTASSGIIVWTSSDVTVSQNEIVLACNLGATSENECLSVGESTRIQVLDNHVHHGNEVRGEGIDVKHGSSHVTIRGNHVHDVASVGIYVDAWDQHTYDIDVVGNTVHDIDGCGFSVGSEQGGRLERVRFVNNLAYDCTLVGIDVHNCCIANHPVDAVEIVNNTLVANGRGDWGGGVLVENDQATGVVVRNNIVSESLSFQIALEVANVSGITVDHNLIDGYRGYEGETRGQAYLEGDPSFVDEIQRDLHLKQGSPAIDAGSALSAPSEDLDGRQRPQGAGIDIGAFEYAAGQVCTLSCNATAPEVARVGGTVTFQGTATVSGCGEKPAFAWAFGDGATSAQQSPTHAYTAADSYDWSLTVTAGEATCRDQGSIEVMSATGGWRYGVAAVAHNPGVGGTMWRTDVAVLNPNVSSAALSITFRATDGALLVETANVPAGGLREWRNVLESGFGVEPGVNVAGSLILEATVPVLVTCRTYNQTEDGTYGQFLPGTGPDGTLGPGEVGYLPQVRKGAGFRTNLGVVNLTAESTTVRLTLFTAEGRQLGTPVRVELAPDAWHQVNDVVAAVGGGEIDVGYATVEVTSAAGEVWAYLSLIDNRTGDATTIPVGLPSGL